MRESDCWQVPFSALSCRVAPVRVTKRNAVLPIGRTARLAFEIDGIRAACCQAAEVISNKRPLDEPELEECAMLDDALAEAHFLLKRTVRKVMLSRLSRRSRAR